MEASGTIKLIDETKEYGSNGFRKRELVLTTDDRYPQHLMIEFIQDNCDLLNSFQVGQNVKISINLRGREWVNPEGETKYFNSIQGWRIEKLDESSESNDSSIPPLSPFEISDEINKEDAGEEDDLPF